MQSQELATGTGFFRHPFPGQQDKAACGCSGGETTNVVLSFSLFFHDLANTAPFYVSGHPEWCLTNWLVVLGLSPYQRSGRRRYRQRQLAPRFAIKNGFGGLAPVRSSLTEGQPGGPKSLRDLCTTLPLRGLSRQARRLISHSGAISSGNGGIDFAVFKGIFEVCWLPPGFHWSPLHRRLALARGLESSPNAFCPVGGRGISPPRARRQPVGTAPVEGIF